MFFLYSKLFIFQHSLSIYSSLDPSINPPNSAIFLRSFLQPSQLLILYLRFYSVISPLNHSLLFSIKSTFCFLRSTRNLSLISSNPIYFIFLLHYLVISLLVSPESSFHLFEFKGIGMYSYNLPIFYIVYSSLRICFKLVLRTKTRTI